VNKEFICSMKKVITGAIHIWKNRVEFFFFFLSSTELNYFVITGDC
jgi:hypothetical protein